MIFPIILLNQLYLRFGQSPQRLHHLTVVFPEPLVFLLQIADVLFRVLNFRDAVFQQAAGFIAHVLFHQPQGIPQVKDGMR